MSTSTKMPAETSNSSPSPEDLSQMVQGGSAALDQGDLRAALEIFEQVITAFPDRPEGHNNLGSLYTSLGEFAKAEDCFSKVLEILPNNPNVLYNRGVVRSKQEKFDGAREDFEKARKARPEDPDLSNNLGVIAFMQGRLKLARKNFRKAAKYGPLNTNVVLNLCDVEIAEGNQAAAVSLCEDFLEKQNDLDIRRRHVELLSSGCRQALDKAAQMGAWVSLDNYNIKRDSKAENAFSTAWYIERILALRDAGVLDHVLLSHDAGWYRPGEPGGGDFRGYTDIFTTLLPMLKETGFSSKEIDQLMIENPGKAFAVR